MTHSTNSEASWPQTGASRARSGERDASKGSIVLIVPLPACPDLGRDRDL
jgi:hypothetical protein